MLFVATFRIAFMKKTLTEMRALPFLTDPTTIAGPS